MTKSKNIFPKQSINYYYLIALFFLLFIMPSASIAQVVTPSVDQDTVELKQDTIKIDDSEIQQKLENVAESTQSEDADYTDLVEALSRFAEHPINLNHTDREELEQLQLLNDIQINNLLVHINKNGNLITIYELQSIKGFDLQTIRKILPYVRVTDNFGTANFNLKEMFSRGQNMVMLRYGQTLEKQTGFTPIDSAALYKSPNSRYIGSPQKLYARYRFTYGGNVSWGVTAEKDQGELFFKDKQNFKYDWYNQSLKGNQGTGFDFYSAHLYIHNIKFIKSLAIGDYQVTFGQGLTAWTSYAFGKTADVMGVKKSALGIHPYTSVDENKFLRGAAATFNFKGFELTGFYSKKHVDANVSDTSQDGEVAAISALQATGYHTTPAEIADKHSLIQTIIGGNVGYKGRTFSVGLTALDYNLNKDFNRSLSYYSQFEFASKHNFNIGLDYNFIFRNFNLFGEEARSNNGGMAYLNGALVSLDPKLSLTFLHRYFARDYQNLEANAFAENSTPQNEKGTYIGITAKPNNVITITSYYDRFEFPWMKYQVDAPSHGNDYVAQINYTPSKKMDMYFRIRQREKQKNTSNPEAVISYLVPVKDNHYRFNISYSILPSVKLKSRVELIEYKLDNNKTQNGYVVYQDIMFNKIGKPLSVSLRYALFQTDSYDARIYTYETDIPGVYSIPALYDRGSRFYILLDYNITRRIEVWFHYSQTFYDNQQVISQGALTEIKGSTKSEIRAQVKFKF
jgi:DNA uptake protein ComE-like DNA-binding protein